VGARTVTYAVDVVVVKIEVYLNVVVPVAPVESVAVMTYVPVDHAEFPPTFVEYENAPPDPTATFCASSACEEPCWVTMMKTLSGAVGAGVTVPAIVYDTVPEYEAPDVGLEKAIEPAAAAASGDSISATSSGIDRSWSFMLSPKLLPV